MTCRKLGRDTIKQKRKHRMTGELQKVVCLVTGSKVSRKPSMVRIEWRQVGTSSGSQGCGGAKAVRKGEVVGMKK